MLRVGFANYAFFFATSANSRTIALLALGIVSVNLHKPGVIDIFTERLQNGLEVSSQTVRGKLNAIRKAGGHIRHERISGLRVAFAKSPARNQLSVGINCCPGPNIPRDLTLRNVRRDLLLLAVAEGPNLIDLHALAGQMSERPILIGRA